MKYIVWDIETLSNFSSFYFIDYQTKREKYFVLHDSQNDFVALITTLKQIYIKNYVLVGFNSIQFDAQIIEHLILNYKNMTNWNGGRIAAFLYQKAQEIINCPEDSKFDVLIPEWKLSIQHVDIYKQKHYDGMGKRCSLKWLEFTMRFPNIETMPIPHTAHIDKDDIPSILAYNRNDVLATMTSFDINQFELEIRTALSQEYNLNLINSSEPRLAREIFGHIIAAEMNIPYKDLKEMRSFRNQIVVGDIIFDYVKFDNPVLKGVHEFYKKLVFNPYKFDENNIGTDKIEKVFKFANIGDVGIGLGGIHGCVKPGVYEQKKEWVIHDLDVVSYYPNLAIKNNLYPEHLSQSFCTVYEHLFEERKKIPKKDPKNYVYKIILNSTYGLSKEPNNYFHDPKYTFSITINGQLLILMLAEKLKKEIPDLVFYQMNTDGVSIGYNPIHTEKVKVCMRDWEKYTSLELEDKYYKKMVIMDVNNYIAVDTKDKIKRKGLFAYSMDPEDKELDYHKNPSALVIPKALEAYFIHGVEYRDYIMGAKDIYDFCYGVKVKKDFDLMLQYIDSSSQREQLKQIKQTVVRYYISKNPTKLKKKYKKGTKLAGRFIELAKGHNSTYFNIFEKKPMPEYNIDYMAYILEARKIVDAVQPSATNLKLF